MPRASKAKHVVVKLRKGLGLQQKELAKRCGIPLRTFQDIERGVFRLSRQKAFAISANTGVSADWLLENDPKAPITNVDGKAWSQKDRQRVTEETKSVISFIEGMGPHAEMMATLLAVPSCPVLFDHYLTSRTFFRKVRLKDLEPLLRSWHKCQKKAWQDFIAASGYSPGKATEHLNRPELESIRDDIDYVERLLKIEP